MKYEIVLTDTAREHYRGLDARGRSLIKKGLKDHLTFEPTRLNRSRMICLFPAHRKWIDPYKTLIRVLSMPTCALSVLGKGEAYATPSPLPRGGRFPPFAHSDERDRRFRSS
uniref:Type II toxin-antitoxin system RelE/ParE family toxin n=1 Tax=Candidatus Kentrum sp. SD TaxID=2126332 RepID=A0A450YL58_9GAMM|nr:MAG: hypothetical protein BECKSD772F_GA0070984_11182 [Candidatus Kentron sp. SD]VFK48174.1 MAG: hypothetical protein BECKSD772E_GA0070983_111515 [Candidatus Kentron sp. SD]